MAIPELFRKNTQRAVDMVEQKLHSHTYSTWPNFHFRFLVITNLNDVPSLLLNTGEAGNWVIVGLQADRGNRSAIGARVTVEAQGRKQTHEVRSASSFYSSSGLRLHFGLATATRIDKLTVFWPGGG